jgi:restriction endonuclease S subunit
MNSGSLKHLGKIAVAQSDHAEYIGGFLAILRCSDPVDRSILEYNLLSLRFRTRILGSKGSDISNLTETKLKGLKVLIPKDRDAFERERDARIGSL